MADLGFETTSTGYQATDAQVQYWEQRDTCPVCTQIQSPVQRLTTGDLVYRCDCDRAEPVRWTRLAADVKAVAAVDEHRRRVAWSSPGAVWGRD